MILIPQRLFDAPQVETILRDGNVCVLRKALTEPVLNREAYVSNHVVSIVLAGEQHIRPTEGRTIRVRAGEVVFLPRGIYYVTDLLPESGGTFRSLLSYFDDAVIEQFLAATRVSEVDPRAGRSYLQFGLEPSIRLFADNLLAAVTAYEQQQPLYLANATKELYAAAVAEGMGRLDFAAIHQYLTRASA